MFWYVESSLVFYKIKTLLGNNVANITTYDWIYAKNTQVNLRSMYFVSKNSVNISLQIQVQLFWVDDGWT